MALAPTQNGSHDRVELRLAAGSDDHLNGKVAAALMEKADELFASPPQINKLEVIASKLP